MEIFYNERGGGSRFKRLNFDERIHTGAHYFYIYILRGGGRHLDSIFDERKYTVALYSICTMCEEA